MLNVAVIGVGRLGTIHTKLIKEFGTFNLVGVVDPVESNRHVASVEFNTTAFEDLDAVIDQIDAAIIATPTVFHHIVSKQLIQHGKHVLIEKPITPTLNEADELIALAHKNDCVLQVGHVERFNPAFIASRDHLTNVRWMESSRTSGYTFRSTDVSVVLDLMIHDIDLMLNVIQSDIRDINAFGFNVVGPHADVAYAHISFVNGAQAKLTASRCADRCERALFAASEHQNTSIDFTKATASVQYISDEMLKLEIDPLNVTVEEKNNLADRFFTELVPRREISVAAGNAIVSEHLDFARAITTGQHVEVPGAAGRDALAVALEIQQRLHVVRHDAPHNDVPSPNTPALISLQQLKAA